MPFNTCLAQRVSAAESQFAWQNLGGVFVMRRGGRPFKFAAPTDKPPTLKADAELLYAHPLAIINFLGLFAAHPCVMEADALSFVPNGPADFTRWLGEIMAKPVIALMRPDGAARDDLHFKTARDQARAAEASSVCLIEDISRTGFSAYVTAALLRGVNPDLDIHTLSMLQREEIDARYQNPRDPGSIVYHTFRRQDIPLDVASFRAQFPDIPVGIVP